MSILNPENREWRRDQVARAIHPFIDLAERRVATNHVPRDVAWKKALEAADAVLTLLPQMEGP